MSDRSAIEWTDATWNPVRGCTKVSPGCKFCYAELLRNASAVCLDTRLSKASISDSFPKSSISRCIGDALGKSL